VGVPLGATRNDSVFKTLFLDIGLLNAACGVSGLSLDDLLREKFVHEGPMAEQFVGQHLAFGEEPWVNPELHYWLREGKKDNAEVDYLINVNAVVVPVEVKAGVGGSLRSLHQFFAARGADLAVRFDLNLPSLQSVEHDVVTGAGIKHVRFRLLSLPLYMIGQARRIVGACLEGTCF
jgi:predicted AAA+ superfamily ATPase